MFFNFAAMGFQGISGVRNAGPSRTQVQLERSAEYIAQKEKYAAAVARRRSVRGGGADRPSSREPRSRPGPPVQRSASAAEGDGSDAASGGRRCDASSLIDAGARGRIVGAPRLQPAR